MPFYVNLFCFLLESANNYQHLLKLTHSLLYILRCLLHKQNCSCKNML
uniref:Uncharacterized protein n=1 Tax=Anguilla anguilla TaxID=7936 RepID=A0A0E9XWP5_ANGAN